MMLPFIVEKKKRKIIVKGREHSLATLFSLKQASKKENMKQIKTEKAVLKNIFLNTKIQLCN